MEMGKTLDMKKCHEPVSTTKEDRTERRKRQKTERKARAVERRGKAKG